MFKSLKHTKKEKQSSVNSKSNNGFDQSYDHQHETESENKIRSYQLKADKQNENSSLSAIQKKSNGKSTGLPEGLRSGVESLSGKDMSDVNVHYNSDKPQKMGALAYAQGTNIHVGKGQEKHLPHEAWHVVQQKQGRVKPTIQKKGNIPVNDDTSLEKEADLMGDEANELGDQVSDDIPLATKNPIQKVVQLVGIEEEEQELKIPDKDKILNNQSDLSENENDSEDNAEDESSGSIEIKPETLVLSGQKGLYAKISSFFGKETSFGKILNLVKEFESQEEDKKKKVISEKIVAEGEKWLDKHPKEENTGKGFFGRMFGKMKMGVNRLRGKTKNDDKKRESIKLIVERFENSEDPSNVSLTTLEDKKSLGSKIKGLFGFESTFIQIEEKYHDYQSKASSSITNFSELKSILDDAGSIMKLIAQWKFKHNKKKKEEGKQEGGVKEEYDDKDKSKNASLDKIKEGLSDLFIEANFKNIVHIKISKLGISEDSDIVTAKNIDIKINIQDKELTGNGTDIEIGDDGINFKEIEINYDGDINVSDDLEISKPKFHVSQNGENYNISASGGLKLSMEIPNAVVEASGNVEVNYSTETKKFHSTVLKEGNVTATMFNGNLVVTGEEMDYENGVFRAVKGDAHLKLFKFNTEVSNLSYSKKNGVDWESIKVKVDKEFKAGDFISVKSPEAIVQGKSEKYAYEIKGNVGLTIPSLPASSTMNFEGVVTVSGVPDQIKKIDVKDGAVDLTIGENLHAKASTINYDKDTGTMTASKASLKLILFNKTLDSEVKDLTVSKEGIDWEIATFKFSDENKSIGLDNLLSVKDVVATAKGKKGNYEKNATGTVEMGSNIIPGATISADGLSVSMTYNEGKWSFNVMGDGLKVSLLEGRLILKSNKLKYENKKLEMESLGISLKLPTGTTIDAEGSGVVIEKSKVDWEEIKLKLTNLIPDIGALKLGNGDLILKGKAEDYSLALNLGASIEKDWFKASGKANLLWNFQKENFPKVESYQMIFGLNSPKIPDAFMPPGTWPISFNLTMPFVIGVIPMEAEVGFEATAGAVLGISGTISKANDETKIKGLGRANAKLGVSVKGSLGVGSGYVLKLAGFLKGAAIANADLEMGLDGVLDEKYNLTSLIGDYEVDAEFLARLSAGVEVKALVIFNKTLYEVTLKEWPLGSSKKKGKYDFIEKSNQDDSTTGLFKGTNLTKSDVKDPPPVVANTKEYLIAIQKFYDILKEHNPEQNIQDISSDDSVLSWDSKAQPNLKDSEVVKSNKEKCIEILQKSINDTKSKKDFIKYQKKLVEQKEKYASREKKLQQAKDGTLKWNFRQKLNVFSKRDEKHFKEKLKQTSKKIETTQSQAFVFQNQIERCEAYIDSMDSILKNPELSLSEIDSKINQYQTLRQEALNKKYKIEKYLSNEDPDIKETDITS